MPIRRWREKPAVQTIGSTSRANPQDKSESVRTSNFKYSANEGECHLPCDAILCDRNEKTHAEDAKNGSEEFQRARDLMDLAKDGFQVRRNHGLDGFHIMG